MTSKPQAKGLPHTSLGQRPGFMAPKGQSSTESAYHRPLPPHGIKRQASIPNIAFIELDVVLSQHLPEYDVHNDLAQRLRHKYVFVESIWENRPATL